MGGELYRCVWKLVNSLLLAQAGCLLKLFRWWTEIILHAAHVTAAHPGKDEREVEGVWSSLSADGFHRLPVGQRLPYRFRVFAAAFADALHERNAFDHQPENIKTGPDEGHPFGMSRRHLLPVSLSQN